MNIIPPKKISISIVLLVAFVDWMGIGFVYPMFSSMFFQPDALFFRESTDVIRGLWLGILLAAMPLAQFISSPILGAMSDIKGRKPILTFTLIIASLGYLLSTMGVWQKNFVLLLLGRFVVGIAAGNAAVANAVITDISHPDEKAKNFGLINMASGLGFTVGPFMGGQLSQWFGGFDTPFLFAGALTFFNLILLYLIFKETCKPSTKKTLEFSWGAKKFKESLHIPGMRSLLLAIFIFCFGWSFYWEFIPITWIEKYGRSAAQVGDFYAYAACFYALSCGVFIRPIANRFRTAPILFYSLLGTGLFLFFLTLNTEAKNLWFYLPIQQSLIAFLFPMAAALVSNWSAHGIQGEMMGIYQSVESFAFAMSPLISGAIAGLSHNTPLFVGGSAMLLAALILGAGCKKHIWHSHMKS